MPGALVDFHPHFVTDDYIASARQAGHTVPDHMPAWPAWSAEVHLALMDEARIDKAILSVSSPGIHFGDDELARDVARHVNDVGTSTAGSIRAGSDSSPPCRCPMSTARWPRSSAYTTAMASPDIR
jgi:6-methylsalicylate decarboxylase